MNKRNITLVAALLATAVAIAFQVFPQLYHSAFFHAFQLPAIFLAVALSSGSHSPGAIAAWTSFIAYTLVYWLAFIVIYALLLEMFISRRANRHLRDAHETLRPDMHPAAALEKVGLAILETESARRRSLFLTPARTLDLGQPPSAIAAGAITRASQEKAVKTVLKRLKSNLNARIGSEATFSAMTRLNQAAQQFYEGGPASR